MVDRAATDILLFVDLDGVLADFDRGVQALTGRFPSEQPPGVMWPILARSGHFYAELEWMPDGKELWASVKPFAPLVLTGLPRGRWAEPQKREWCRRELGPDVEVITCLSREKAIRARERTPEGITPVLIDDRGSLREAWEAMGGVFIHHESAEGSIQELRAIRRF